MVWSQKTWGIQVAWSKSGINEKKKETKLKVERHWLCEEQKTSKQKKHYILRS